MANRHYGLLYKTELETLAKFAEVNPGIISPVTLSNSSTKTGRLPPTTRLNEKRTVVSFSEVPMNTLPTPEKQNYFT